MKNRKQTNFYLIGIFLIIPLLLLVKFSYFQFNSIAAFLFMLVALSYAWFYYVSRPTSINDYEKYKNQIRIPKYSYYIASSLFIIYFSYLSQQIFPILLFSLCYCIDLFTKWHVKKVLKKMGD